MGEVWHIPPLRQNTCESTGPKTIVADVNGSCKKTITTAKLTFKKPLIVTHTVDMHEEQKYWNSEKQGRRHLKKTNTASNQDESQLEKRPYIYIYIKNLNST